MLVFTRRLGEQIQIGDHITVTVAKVAAQAVRLGVEAPADTPIVRRELLETSPAPKASTAPEMHEDTGST